MNPHYLLSFIFLSILYHPVEVLRTDLAQNTANYSSKFERPDVDLHAQFKDYVTRFNRSYLNDPKEYSNRKYIFMVRCILRYVFELGKRGIYVIIYVIFNTVICFFMLRSDCTILTLENVLFGI